MSLTEEVAPGVSLRGRARSRWATIVLLFLRDDVTPAGYVS